MSRSRVLTVTLLLAVVGALTAASPTGAAEAPPPGGHFTDDDGITHEGAIEAIRAEGITIGCSPTRYCPHDPVTRGQMAAFLNRALDLPAAPTPSGFTDTAGTFHEIKKSFLSQKRLRIINI